MQHSKIFNFSTDISEVRFPDGLNNPFGACIPQIARIAAVEFQEFLELATEEWGREFPFETGKMFGVLVICRKDGSTGYLATNSGRTPMEGWGKRLVPSMFDGSADDFFMDRGMKTLSEITTRIEKAAADHEIELLKVERKCKSINLQAQLFSHYNFINIRGHYQNIIKIFEASLHKKPPSAAGECAAPKLLQYAIEHELKPLALAEFWWGGMPKNRKRQHKEYYPACKDKCRPILEYMLDDDELYRSARRRAEV